MGNRVLAGVLVLALVSAGGVGVGTVGGATDRSGEHARTAESGSDAGRAAEPIAGNLGRQGTDCNYTTTFGAAERSVVSVSAENESYGWGGSGWVYSVENGTAYVVTNWHVTHNATDVDVQFGEQGWRNATVVGSDLWTDLAVVAVENPPSTARALPVVESSPRRGQSVALVGTPFRNDWEASITRGIVSGEDRLVTVEALPGLNVTWADMIQTDAAANPGNSGGPLLNCEGAVLGVLNSGWGFTNAGVNFAISARVVREVVPALVANGSYPHSSLGADVANVGPDIAEANDLPVSTGVMVTAVEPGGPSDGKLREAPAFHLTEYVPYDGDVVLAVDGTRISDREDLLSYLLLETRPNETVSLTVLRNGENRTVEVTLGERPAIPPRPTENATVTNQTTTPDRTTAPNGTTAPSETTTVRERERTATPS
ncbi:trypsin-like peptidase domain-containing protein [Halorussus limi]|uniref:Trypsin-like peptidase domain-containing protein n=1 Tax=Halorussus limi TaxID=2938695 RepID=A0A8U0HYE0_9EURY|nr:trypsin-like peptidase domain-containing protein [Halorussus limi]UPV75937.1 trypsin-like peptidase domain-containing protein [Halorussus limi]